jgi:hypothetical protein
MCPRKRRTPSNPSIAVIEEAGNKVGERDPPIFVFKEEGGPSSLIAVSKEADDKQDKEEEGSPSSFAAAEGRRIKRTLLPW